MTRCTCAECRPRRTLADIAPRLTRAQTEVRREHQLAQGWLPKLRVLVQRAQWKARRDGRPSRSTGSASCSVPRASQGLRLVAPR
jgi:hypothetical protein